MLTRNRAVVRLRAEPLSSAAGVWPIRRSFGWPPNGACRYGGGESPAPAPVQLQLEAQGSGEREGRGRLPGRQQQVNVPGTGARR
jgi:hypothetical protein